MTGRSCCLLFQGSPRKFSPVSVGTSQGSPVFPLLFVIYVAPLLIPLSRGLVLSYVDDFSLTVSSPSYRTNSRSLQAAFGRIRAIAHSRKVDFSVPKTELIHWRIPLQSDPPGTPRPPPVALDGQIFHPSEKVRWLGYWLVPNLASSAHFSRRLALSQAAFSSVRGLSDAGKGVSPHLCDRLAYCLMFPILSYSADLLTPTKGVFNKMEVHCRQVQRWVTNCFRPLQCRFSPLRRAFHLSLFYSHTKDGWLLSGSSPHRHPSTPPRPASAGPFPLYSRPGRLTPIGPCAQVWLLTSCHSTGKLRSAPPQCVPISRWMH